MAEYIEREALMKVLKFRIKGQHRIYDAANMVLSLVEDYVNATPTADVVEVRHGKWIYHDFVASGDGIKSGFSCSECRGFVDEEIFDSDEFHKSFCGCCGAKMDGKGDSSEQMHRY